MIAAALWPASREALYYLMIENTFTNLIQDPAAPRAAHFPRRRAQARGARTVRYVGPPSWRVIIYLKHTPSFGDSRSSHILNTPPHLAISVHHKPQTRPLIGRFRASIRPLIWRYVSSTRPLVWRFQFIRYLEHAPSFDDSGSSYSLNISARLAIPVHDIS